MSACVQMMPRLEAEESLRETERIGVGIAGWGFKPDVARRIQRGWQNAAQVGPGATRPPRAPLATPAVLGGMGIGYQVVKP